MSNVFAYVCTVDEAPEARAAVEAKAKQLGPDWTRYEETPELAWMHWRKRPRLAVLLRAIGRGDHFVLYQLEQLARTYPLAMDALTYLSRIGVTVHLLDWGGEQMELDERTVPTFIQLLSVSGAWNRQSHRGSRLTKTSHFTLCHAPHVPWGRRRTRSPLGVTVDVWCPVQCAIIREVMGRKNAGETWRQIAHDFYERKLRDSARNLWCPRKTRHAKHPSSKRIEYMLQWYRKLLKDGGQLEA